MKTTINILKHQQTRRFPVWRLFRLLGRHHDGQVGFERQPYRLRGGKPEKLRKVGREQQRGGDVVRGGGGVQRSEDAEEDEALERGDK